MTIQINFPPQEAWTKNISAKMSHAEFRKMEIKSNIDQSKYTRNDLVQPIRIENLLKKCSDGI